jgi:hypothetical protein
VQITGTSSGKHVNGQNLKNSSTGGGGRTAIYGGPGEEQEHFGGKTGVEQLYLEVSGEEQQQMSG